ncbi:hypothetical protein GGF32_007422 [Allomyces javanicus]|nr:hypothetical protein GGF32_007422 [Allomyces javanicus]
MIDYCAEKTSGHPVQLLASIMAPNLTCLKIHLNTRKSWSEIDMLSLARLLPVFPSLRELQLLGGIAEVDMYAFEPNRWAEMHADPLLEAIPESLTKLSIRLPNIPWDIKTPMFVSSALAIPAHLEELDLSSIAREDDVFDLAMRIPPTVRTLRLWLHVSARAVRVLAMTPRPYLKKLILSGVCSDCDMDMIANLDRILVPTVTELWIATTGQYQMNGRALSAVLRERIPKLARLEILGFQMDKEGVAEIINALPARSLGKLGLKVPDLSSDKIAELVLTRTDWQKMRAGLDMDLSDHMVKLLQDRGIQKVYCHNEY